MCKSCIEVEISRLPDLSLKSRQLDHVQEKAAILCLCKAERHGHARLRRELSTIAAATNLLCSVRTAASTSQKLETHCFAKPSLCCIPFCPCCGCACAAGESSSIDVSLWPWGRQRDVTACHVARKTPATWLKSPKRS